MSDKSIKELEIETVKNWETYSEQFDDKINEMWNFVMYSDFSNNEIKRLHREVKFLNDDLKSEKRKIEDLEFDLSYVKDKNKRIKTSKKTIIKIKKDKDKKWFNDEKKKKPKTYVGLDKKSKDDYLKTIFAKLESINDIINLKNEIHRFDYFKYDKFKKLYQLIPCLERLNSVIGMKKVKDNVFQMICYFLHGLNGSGELNHCVITGPPGVGKTTLASLLGDIYLRLGFLKNNKFVIARRSELIGKYCGHTAVQTQNKIDEAEGGVLFIDEVYSLGNVRKSDSFTKECIDTINQNLTENGDKFLCIIAGYKKDVDECFFAYNRGLERRFPLRFNIEKYDHKELHEIFMKFVNEENWNLERRAFNPEDLKDNMELFKFYGGDMKTLFQSAKKFYSLRLMKESIDGKDINRLIKREDIKNAINSFKENRKKEEIPDFVKNMFL
jgi:SpoVK/Ycf46/Vps4 family AAA+-type ATPase